jgi:hypothetical protein
LAFLLEFCDFTYQASEGCPWGQKERLIFFVQLPVIYSNAVLNELVFGQIISGRCTGRIIRSKLFSHYGFSVISDKY